MRYKKNLLVICIIICLFSITSVSASDVNDTVVTSGNDEIVAIGNQNIVLPPNENILSISDDFNIIGESNDDRVLDGNGTTISEVMIISGNNVTLMNYNFVGGYSTGDYPGALKWVGDNGKIINCTFTNNYGSPGAILMKGNNCRIIDCTFTNNHLKALQFGGAIKWDGANGTIIHSVFTGTESPNEGGAIYWNGEGGKIIDCTFSNNHAWRGGAIQFGNYDGNGKNSMVINSTFIKNYDSQGGGAIYTWARQDIIITNCTFIENSGSGVIGSNGVKLINNSYFYMNTGGIGSSGNITNSLFYKNTGHVQASNIINSIFLDNTVKKDDNYPYISTSTNLDFNWFGNTVYDYNINPNIGGTIKNWLFINATHESLILVGKEINSSFVFQVWDGTNVLEYDFSQVYPVDLILSATNGVIDKNYAVMGENILYNASEAGIGSITAKFFDKELTINLTCKNPTEIIVSEPITIFVDQFINFTGDGFSTELIPSEAGSLSYSSDNETILIVNNTGFKGVNEGIANIIVEFKETDEFGPAKVSVPISVIRYDTEISANNTMNIDYGKCKTIDARLIPNIGDLVYSSGDVNIATVDENGLISVINAGTTNITVKFEGDRKYKPSSKNIILTVNKVNSTILINNGYVFNYNDSYSVPAIVEGIESIDGFIIDNPEAIVKINNKDIIINNLDVGNYTLVATTIPDKNHISVSTTSKIYVNKINSTLYIPKIEYDYGRSTTVTAIVNGVVEIVNVRVENHSEALVYVVGDKITVSGLDAGEYTLVATTIPDKNHISVNSSTIIIVNQVSSFIEFTNNIKFDYGKSDYTGVNFKFASGISDVKVINHPKAIININDNIITVSGLDAGNYTLIANTIPDKNHYSVNATTKITVNKIPSFIDTINDIVLDYGGSNFTDVVFEGATNIIANVINHPEAIIDVVGNKITISGLNTGEYTLIVTTVPDKNHNAINKTAKIFVNRIDPLITILPIVYNYGQIGSTKVLVTDDIKFTAKVVYYPEAIVGIDDKIITVSGLDVGNYVLNITTIQNKNYNSITKNINVTVAKSDSDITIDDIIFNYGSYGESSVELDGATNFTANVINNPEATIYIDSSRIILSGLEVGNYTLVATTIPDKNHNSITKTINVIVDKIPTIISASDINMTYTKWKYLVATLKDNQGNAIDGATLSIKINGVSTSMTTDSNGEIHISTDGLVPDNYTAIITFEGSNIYLESYTFSKIVVNRIDTIISANDVDIAGSEVGNLVANLTNDDGKTLGGANVLVDLNGVCYPLKTNSKGQITVSLTDLSLGTYIATVSYAGNSKYAPSTATAIITVKENIDIAAGYDITDKVVVVSLTNYATGKAVSGANVQVEINGITNAVKTNSKGQAKVSTVDLSPGTYNATISYAGNTKYAPASTSITFSTKIDTVISAVYDTSNSEIVATLTNSATGKAVANTNVQVTFNGETKTVKTNSKGQVKVSTVGLPLGTYPATFSYAGNSKYNAASTSINVDVKTKVIVTDVYAYSDRIVAKLTNGATGKFIANANMIVEINGVKYDAKSDNKGQLTFDTSGLNLPSAYDLTISYRGNDRYTASSATVAVDLNKANMMITTNYHADKQKMVATLKNSKTGKAVSNANMIIDLNGVKTTYKSNDQGKITLPTTDFAPGTYVGTVTYPGNARYNSIGAVFKIDI